MTGLGPTLILLGPPGVGKGTQGVLLSDEFGWERLVTGDLLRAARSQGTELGKRAQTFMDAGDLVPDELVIALVGERLKQISASRGVVFDGFPRTVAQAEALEEALPSVGRGVDAVVLLEAEDEVLVKRIGGRRSCPRCGRVYNVHFDPPSAQGICDECGARLHHREDDDPETVRHRLGVYEAQTRPLVSYYEERPVPVLRVDGEGSLEEVRGALREALDTRLQVGT